MSDILDFTGCSRELDLGEPIGMAEFESMMSELDDEYAKMWNEINQTYEDGIA